MLEREALKGRGEKYRDEKVKKVYRQRTQKTRRNIFIMRTRKVSGDDGKWGREIRNNSELVM